jgi:hypothetical protein
MLKNRSFILAAVIASATTVFAAAPVFAAPVAIATTRQLDREPPMVERQDRRQAAPTSDEAATAPTTIAVKSGFATAPIAADAVFGFGVHASAADVANTGFGFARAGATTKIGFTSVR